MQPHVSAHAHMWAAAEYKAAAGAPNDGARMSNLMVNTSAPQSNTCLGSVVGMSRELSSPGGASTTNGIALTTLMAVAAMAGGPAPWPSAAPIVISQWMSGSPSMSTR